jgi:hypothetical protein
MVERTSQTIDLDDEADATVVELPNLVDGDLADLLAAASAPGMTSELRGEDCARSMFQSAVTMWPKASRLRRPTWAVVAVASVAGLFATTTALAAASALPPSAEHVVNGAFNQADISLGQPAAPVTAGSGVSTQGKAPDDSQHATGVSGRKPRGRSGTASTCHRAGTVTSRNSVSSIRLARSASCGIQPDSAGLVGIGKASGSASGRSKSQRSGTAANSHGTHERTTVSGSGPGKSSTGSSATGRGSKGAGTGAGSGSGSGKTGTGSGKTGSGSGGTGTTTSRGGNLGTGTGRKTGVGKKTGGRRNSGTGKKGGVGSKGGGTHGAGTGHHDRGTAVPGPTSDPSNSGDGTTVNP